MPKAKRDPNKPKGQKSAYNFFVQQERQQASEDDKKIAFTEMSQICAAKWKEMSEKEKLPFVKLAEKDAARFKKEMASYTPPEDDDEDTPRKSKKRKRKDPNQPKRNMSAFMFYSNSIRPELKEENPELGIGDIAKKIGARWQEMKDDQKKKYQDMAATDKERYEEEMTAYRNGEYVPMKKMAVGEE